MSKSVFNHLQTLARSLPKNTHEWIDATSGWTLGIRPVMGLLNELYRYRTWKEAGDAQAQASLNEARQRLTTQDWYRNVPQTTPMNRAKLQEIRGDLPSILADHPETRLPVLTSYLELVQTRYAGVDHDHAHNHDSSQEEPVALTDRLAYLDVLRNGLSQYYQIPLPDAALMPESFKAQFMPEEWVDVAFILQLKQHMKDKATRAALAPDTRDNRVPPSLHGWLFSDFGDILNLALTDKQLAMRRLNTFEAPQAPEHISAEERALWEAFVLLPLAVGDFSDIPVFEALGEGVIRQIQSGSIDPQEILTRFGLERGATMLTLAILAEKDKDKGLYQAAMAMHILAEGTLIANSFTGAASLEFSKNFSAYLANALDWQVDHGNRQVVGGIFDKIPKGLPRVLQKAVTIVMALGATSFIAPNIEALTDKILAVGDIQVQVDDNSAPATPPSPPFPYGVMAGAMGAWFAGSLTLKKHHDNKQWHDHLDWLYKNYDVSKEAIKQHLASPSQEDRNAFLALRGTHPHGPAATTKAAELGMGKKNILGGGTFFLGNTSATPALPWFADPAWVSVRPELSPNLVAVLATRFYGTKGTRSLEKDKAYAQQHGFTKTLAGLALYEQNTPAQARAPVVTRKTETFWQRLSLIIITALASVGLWVAPVSRRRDSVVTVSPTPELTPTPAPATAQDTIATLTDAQAIALHRYYNASSEGVRLQELQRMGGAAADDPDYQPHAPEEYMARAEALTGLPAATLDGHKRNVAVSARKAYNALSAATGVDVLGLFQQSYSANNGDTDAMINDISRALAQRHTTLDAARPQQSKAPHPVEALAPSMVADNRKRRFAQAPIPTWSEANHTAISQNKAPQPTPEPATVRPNHASGSIGIPVWSEATYQSAPPPARYQAQQTKEMDRLALDNLRKLRGDMRAVNALAQDADFAMPKMLAAKAKELTEALAVNLDAISDVNKVPEALLDELQDFVGTHFAAMAANEDTTPSARRLQQLAKASAMQQRG